jgi:hypothetical protein
MRKKINANRRLYQRTRSDEALRERRKATYMEAKSTYQAEIKKAKSTSWKEFCNVAASIRVNPWSQVYKLGTGKTRRASIMTTIRKHDGTETSSLHETVNVILDYLFTEDSEEDNSHHKNIRKAIEEPIHINEDGDFTQEEVKKNTIESFSHKKAPGLDGITGGIYQLTFHMFPRIITTIYNHVSNEGASQKVEDS